jgi:UDP-GlcNAc:undecaprenyl-phosphate GlcNAc-1-phosphate transferase
VTALVPAFMTALVLAIAATYGVRALALRLGIVDVPDGRRRLHEHPVPRVGGVAIYVAFTLVLATAAAFLPLDELRQQRVLAVLLGGAAIFGIGLFDDLRGLSARTKFGLELVVATLLYAAGVSIDAVSVPGVGSVALLPSASFLITVLWLVGITNAFNLLDGSDGVAAGSAVFAAGALAVVSLATGHAVGALVALTLAAATLGFLVFNFPPASIFLGDCGSLFLGFVLAVTGLMTTQTASTMMAVAIPVVSLGLPILDTLLAMARRFLRREPLFNPDRGHIHHRLSDLGHSPRKVVLLLYAASAACALLSLFLVHPNGPLIGGIFLVAGSVVWIGVQRLDIPELLELRRIVHRGLIQRTVIAYNVRIREAARRMRLASEPAEVLNALQAALEAGEFHRAELWLHDGPAAPLLQAELARREPPGAVWRWGEAATLSLVREWELRLPLRAAGAQSIGRLSLWHPIDTAHVLTDLQLIGAELQPELEQALQRCRLNLAAGATEPLAVAAVAVPRAVPAVAYANGNGNGNGNGNANGNGHGNGNGNANGNGNGRLVRRIRHG